MPTIDLDLVSARLFEDQAVVGRLRRDYGLTGPLDDPGELAAALVSSFGQVPIPGRFWDHPESRDFVFRASVRALASNSRSWSTFLRSEKRLEGLLGGYDPDRVAGDLERGGLDMAAIKACLRGQTSGQDAKAIGQWARFLTRCPEFHAAICELRHEVTRRGVAPHEEVPMVAAILGGSFPNVDGPFLAPVELLTWKVPGMGPVLASEFLRNLRWSGFKPDRHVVRLFSRWFPDVLESKIGRARELAELLISKSKVLVQFFQYCLVGTAVTPLNRTYTEVDNLIWALGRYVEKKGRESPCSYRLDPCAVS